METMKEKIELMLQVYKERLKRASEPPADHIFAYSLQVKIGLLEDLLTYAEGLEAEETARRSGGTAQDEGV